MQPPVCCRERKHDTFSSLRATIAEDIHQYLVKSEHDRKRGDNFRTRLSASLTPEVLPIVFYRVAHFLHAAGWRKTAVGLSRCNQMIHRVSIAPQSCIGPGLKLPHPAGVTFHGTAGRCLTLYSMSVCCPRPQEWNSGVESSPSLGDHVTLAGHAVVQGPVTVGNGTTVVFGVSLDRDAPAGVLVTSAAVRTQIRRREGSAIQVSARAHFDCYTHV